MTVVNVGDTLHLSNDQFHTVTTEGELGFADYLVKHGRAKLMNNGRATVVEHAESGEEYYVVQQREVSDGGDADER